MLTGSVVTPIPRKSRIPVGRFTWLTMRPMSIFESGDSSGEVSLKALFGHLDEIDGESTLDIDRFAFLVCRGGWP